MHLRKCSKMSGVMSAEVSSLAKTDDDKSRHLELATFIKSVHADLRKKFKESGDSEAVWSAHCEDTSTLSRYASAMHQLATDIWSRRDDTRIDWCRNVCVDYFLSGGLQRLRDKDERRRLHEASRDAEQAADDDMMGHLSGDEDIVPFEAGTHSEDGWHSEAECGIIDDKGHEDMETGADTGVKMDNDTPPRLKLALVDTEKSLPKIVYAESTDSLGHLDYCASDVLAASLLTTRGSTSSLNVSEMSEVRTVDMSKAEERAPDDGIAVDDDRDRVVQDTDSMDAAEQAPDHLDDLDEEIVHDDHEPVKYNILTLPFTEKIRLLDVGSCYDPFSVFKEFHSVGIDLSPAVSSVLRCDFLRLQLTAPLQLATDSLSTYVSGLRSPLLTLPRSLFHVVVFSLFLGYLPSPRQRWDACRRAAELLMPDGLLLVVTPDSHGQHRNAAIMRGWRVALETLGFVRHRYEKQEHVHYMAFRLLKLRINVKANCAELMCIPQDFSTECDTDGEGKALQLDSSALLDGFNELPGAVK